MTVPSDNSGGVFAGLKVLDFTWLLAGPIVVKYLADNGADVVRVESNVHPDALRISAPYKDRIAGIDRSGYWAYYHSNARSVALDLRNPEAKAIVLRLVAWADVVAENFTAGVMENLGLTYEDLKAVNESVIVARTSSLGQTGPWSRQPNMGFQLSALAGFVSLCGEPGDEPIQPYGAYTDYVAPHFGGAALISALLYRERTGKGQWIDISQHEASLHFQAPLLLDYAVNDRLPVRKGNRSDCAAPHGAFRCRGIDRWCAVAVFSDEQWQSLCKVMGRPDLANDDRFASLASRKAHEDELDRVVEEWTAAQDGEAIVAELQAAGVPCGIVQNEREVLEDPQLAHRGHFWEQDHPIIGRLRVPGPSFRLSETPGRLRRPSPCLGEHTQEVCRELLGMGDEEFVDLLNLGLFQ